MTHQGRAEQLTAVEEQFVQCARAGNRFEFSDPSAVDASAMERWDSSRSIRASVVRDLLRGHLGKAIDPRGLMLRGVRIFGLLDLRHMACGVPLIMTVCHLPDGLDASFADLRALELPGCVVKKGMRLVGAHVGGHLTLSGAALTNDSGAALQADNVHVDQDMQLDGGFTAVGAGAGGAVRLLGARIGGQLDASGAKLTNQAGPALFAECLQVDLDLILDDGFSATGSSSDAGTVRLSGAYIRGQLSLSGATLTNDLGAALHAEIMRVDQGMYLIDGFSAHGSGRFGAVNLTDSRIGSDLVAPGAALTNDSGPGLVADAMQVEHSLFLDDGFSATGHGGATVALSGAHVGHQLSLAGARLSNDTGPALLADLIHVEHSMSLEDGFIATGAGDRGTVSLQSAQIGSQLNAAGAKLTNASGPALHAHGLQVNEDVNLRYGFSATGAGAGGTLSLVGARIGGMFSAADAQLTNDSGPAMNAEHLQVGEDLVLTDGFCATGSGDGGTVQVSGAHVGGQMLVQGATLINSSGPVLFAEALRVEQALALDDMSGTGAGQSGAVRLAGARIGGQLTACGARLINRSGPALDAENLWVERSLDLNEGFFASGSGDKATVRLMGARVAELGMFDAVLTNDRGPALRGDGMQVDRSLDLSRGFSATGSGLLGAVMLRGVHVGGRLAIDSSAIRDSDGHRAPVDIDGLVYSGLPLRSSVAEWLRMLACQTPHYAAQPYRQLASAAQAAGHDGDTRKILMAQRNDQLNRRALAAGPERAWAHLTRLTLGYGYQPWRALLLLLVIAAIAVGLALIGGSRGGLAHKISADEARRAIAGSVIAPSPCTHTELVGVGLDLSLPLIKTHARDHCTTTATKAGDLITITGWILQLCSWALATLFIAGFTGAVRKT